ncbi:uncharacterized protein A4U43_C08F14030 [Asparagus officinalis]|nr:uncharacterized protein A4U43_C08F14030 [Asparagus officinalis]
MQQPHEPSPVTQRAESSRVQPASPLRQPLRPRSSTSSTSSPTPSPALTAAAADAAAPPAPLLLVASPAECHACTQPAAAPRSTPPPPAGPPPSYVSTPAPPSSPSKTPPPPARRPSRRVAPSVLDPRSKRVQNWNRLVLLRARPPSWSTLVLLHASVGRDGAPCLVMDGRGMAAALAGVRARAWTRCHVAHVWVQLRVAYVSKGVADGRVGEAGVGPQADRAALLEVAQVVLVRCLRDPAPAPDCVPMVVAEIVGGGGDWTHNYNNFADVIVSVPPKGLS